MTDKEIALNNEKEETWLNESSSGLKLSLLCEICARVCGEKYLDKAPTRCVYNLFNNMSCFILGKYLRSDFWLLMNFSYSEVSPIGKRPKKKVIPDTIPWNISQEHFINFLFFLILNTVLTL